MDRRSDEKTRSHRASWICWNNFGSGSSRNRTSGSNISAKILLIVIYSNIYCFFQSLSGIRLKDTLLARTYNFDDVCHVYVTSDEVLVGSLLLPLINFQSYVSQNFIRISLLRKYQTPSKTTKWSKSCFFTLWYQWTKNIYVNTCWN